MSAFDVPGALRRIRRTGGRLAAGVRRADRDIEEHPRCRRERRPWAGRARVRPRRGDGGPPARSAGRDGVRSTVWPPTACGTGRAGGSLLTWTPGTATRAGGTVRSAIRGRSPGTPSTATGNAATAGGPVVARRPTISSRSGGTLRPSARGAPSGRTSPENRGTGTPSEGTRMAARGAVRLPLPAGVRRARRPVRSARSRARLPVWLRHRLIRCYRDVCAAASCLSAAARPSPRSAPSPRVLAVSSAFPAPLTAPSELSPARARGAPDRERAAPEPTHVRIPSSPRGCRSTATPRSPRSTCPTAPGRDTVTTKAPRWCASTCATATRR